MRQLVLAPLQIYPQPAAQFTAIDITDGQIVGVVVKITSAMP